MREYGLGHIIDRLKAADQDKVCRIGFHNPHSFRGDYSELAFEPKENVTVREMLAAAESALGKTYSGYKGGDYEMWEGVSCHLSYYGESSDDGLGPVVMSLILGEPLPEVEP